MNRTGSKGSCVGPAVTRIRSPARSFGVRIDSISSAISGRFGEPPLPFGPAGQFAVPRLQNGMAAGNQAGQILLHNGICIHLVVHRRTDEDGRGRGQQDRGQQIVGDARGHLADDVGRRRGNDDQFGEFGKGDVVDLEAPGHPEQVRGDRVSGQGLEGERGDELAGMVGHDHPDLRPAPDQFPDQFGGLVGGNAAGHAQNDSSLLQHDGVPF